MAIVIAEHFTRRWQAAGLIDVETAARIVAWEATHRRPVFLWAVSGMGILALSLGIMAIVGANWEDIPGGAIGHGGASSRRCCCSGWY